MPHQRQAAPPLGLVLSPALIDDIGFPDPETPMSPTIAGLLGPSKLLSVRPALRTLTDREHSCDIARVTIGQRQTIKQPVPSTCLAKGGLADPEEEF